MNEAFLDRFHFCYEQDYADPKVEKRILSKYAGSLGVSDDDFIGNLVNWADLVRKSFKQQVVNEIITTRRLRDIVFAFSVFGDKMQAIERCVSRFDDETKAAFTEFYTKIDATAKAADATAAPAADAAAAPSTKCPF
jgi:MoxR-like ATPase